MPIQLKARAALFAIVERHHLSGLAPPWHFRWLCVGSSSTSDWDGSEAQFRIPTTSGTQGVPWVHLWTTIKANPGGPFCLRSSRGRVHGYLSSCQAFFGSNVCEFGNALVRRSASGHIPVPFDGA